MQRCPTRCSGSLSLRSCPAGSRLGEPLPAERELALQFGVNRHAIREALKGVRQAGLVRISQGDKTRVLDWRENAGLDVLTALATTGAVPSVELMRDVFEMRRSIAADAARLCAQRADDAQIAAVLDAAASYLNAPTTPRPKRSSSLTSPSGSPSSTDRATSPTGWR